MSSLVNHTGQPPPPPPPPWNSFRLYSFLVIMWPIFSIFTLQGCLMWVQRMICALPMSLMWWIWYDISLGRIKAKRVCEPMMTSSNGNIFRVTDPLCGEFTGPGEFPTQRPVTRSFSVFFDLRFNKRLSKLPRGWWFETPSWSLWRQCNAFIMLPALCLKSKPIHYLFSLHLCIGHSR